jgi:hypothetical protein
MPCSLAWLANTLHTMWLTWCCFTNLKGRTRPCFRRLTLLCTHSYPSNAALMVASAFSGRTLSCRQVRGLTMSGMYQQFLRSGLSASSFFGLLWRTWYHPSLVSLGSEVFMSTVTTAQCGLFGGSPVVCLMMKPLWIDCWMFFCRSFNISVSV